MIAYKFRGADQICWILDIISNKRLHCGGWKSLNDKSEGHYILSKSDQKALVMLRTLIGKIKQAKFKILICPLCKELEPRMWVDYANDYNGVAIEVTVPKGAVRNIEYRKNLPTLQALAGGRDFRRASEALISKIAKNILTVKLNEWKHEKEVRIFHHEEKFPITPRKVIIGHRMNSQLCDTLQVICNRKSIKVQFTKFSNGKVTTVDRVYAADCVGRLHASQ